MCLVFKSSGLLVCKCSSVQVFKCSGLEVFRSSRFRWSRGLGLQKFWGFGFGVRADKNDTKWNMEFPKRYQNN